MRFGSGLEPKEGYAAIKGKYSDGAMIVDEILDEQLFQEGTGYLSIEAAIALDSDGEGFHLSGFGIPIETTDKLPAEPGMIAVFEGAFDGRMRIEAVRSPN